MENVDKQVELVNKNAEISKLRKELNFYKKREQIRRNRFKNIQIRKAKLKRLRNIIILYTLAIMILTFSLSFVAKHMVKELNNIKIPAIAEEFYAKKSQEEIL